LQKCGEEMPPPEVPRNRLRRASGTAPLRGSREARRGVLPGSMARLDGDVANVMCCVARDRAFGERHAVEHDKAECSAGGQLQQQAACGGSGVRRCRGGGSVHELLQSEKKREVEASGKRSGGVAPFGATAGNKKVAAHASVACRLGGR